MQSLRAARSAKFGSSLAHVIGGEHIQKEYLEKIARERDNVRLHVCYSRPGAEDVQGKDYHHAERVSVEVFKRVLPSNNYDFFICGPGAMMKSITDGLKEWGVPDKNVLFEAFGPATVKKAAAPAPVNASAAPIKVTFSKSGKVVQWNAEASSLLDFAEANGVQIEAVAAPGIAAPAPSPSKQGLWNSGRSSRCANGRGLVPELHLPAEIRCGAGRVM
jgi:hypothetical protein